MIKEWLKRLEGQPREHLEESSRKRSKNVRRLEWRNDGRVMDGSLIEWLIG